MSTLTAFADGKAGDVRFTAAWCQLPYGPFGPGAERPELSVRLDNFEAPDVAGVNIGAILTRLDLSGDGEVKRGNAMVNQLYYGPDRYWQSDMSAALQLAYAVRGVPDLAAYPESQSFEIEAELTIAMQTVLVPITQPMLPTVTIPAQTLAFRCTVDRLHTQQAAQRP